MKEESVVLHHPCGLQLQIESEERLHDYGERIRTLQREKEEILSKLEDKQKDLDDLSFQLEEESISKADLEVNFVTDVVPGLVTC